MCINLCTKKKEELIINKEKDIKERMQVMKVPDYTEMSKKAMGVILDRISEYSDVIIALPTGNTPEMLYSLLVEEHKRGSADFGDVVVFNLDEYAGLESADPNSYYHYINERFLKHVNIKRSHLLNGMAEDLEKECRDYEDYIKNEGRIDIVILGIGRNGHVAFNEPGTSFDSLTHVVELDEDTRKANARFFFNGEEVPRKALTMGIKTIMDAREIILMASGKEKSNAIKEAIKGEITERVPASILQKHKNCKVIMDGDAGAYLGNRFY